MLNGSKTERFASGDTLINLVVQEVHEDLDGQYIHKLIPRSLYNVEDCSFEANDYIIVNTTNRFAITSGYVLHVEINSIKVLLDRYINIFYKIFRYF